MSADGEMNTFRDGLQELATLPHNLDAEQSVLGACLYDNGVVEELDGLKPEHFLEGFHARLYAAILDMVRKRTLAEPIVLFEQFKTDEALETLGGLRYLASLVDHAPPAKVAKHLAEVVSGLALKRGLITFAEETAYEARRGATTGAEQLEDAEQRLFGLADQESTPGGFVAFSDALAKSVEMTAEAYSRDGGLSGLATGLLDLDRKLGGLHDSDLIIIASRPSMGKTSLATNIAYHVAKSYAWTPKPDGTIKTTAGGVVGFFSLEMSRDQLASRILSEVSRVPSDRMRRGDITAQDYGVIREAAMEIQSSPLHIDDTGALAIEKMMARARRLKRTVGLDLIVVDYLQLATGARNRRNDNRVQEVTEITQGLKAMAKDLSVPVVALSQLSRKVEERDDKRPMLSDLRESGSIEQDADVVMFIYRESYYLERSEPEATSSQHPAWMDKMDACRGTAEVIIGKQRHGPIGTVRLSFDDRLTKFGNLAPDRPSGYRDPSGVDR